MQKFAEVRVNKLLVNVVGSVLAVVVCAGTLVLAQALPHHVPPAAWHWVALLVAIVLLIFIHEGLHAAALMVVSKLPLSAFKFGFYWKALMPYCHCKVPVGIGAYRRMGLCPLCVTGSFSVLVLLVYPSDWWGLMTGITLSTCIGDVWMVAKLRKFPDDVLVQDHPTEIGCDIFTAAEPDQGRDDVHS